MNLVLAKEYTSMYVSMYTASNTKKTAPDTLEKRSEATWKSGHLFCSTASRWVLFISLLPAV
jgi:hypothetical protein